MRPELHVERAKAAVLDARRRVEPSPRAEEIARVAASAARQTIADSVAQAIAEEIYALRVSEEAREREEKVLHEACRSVGAAVDRLQQSRYTAAEKIARDQLEKAAVRLRREIARRDARARR